MKRAKRTIVILSLALASCRAPVYTPTATPQSVSVTVLATTSTYTLLEALANGYSLSGMRVALHSASASWDAVRQQLEAGAAPFALTTYLAPDSPLWAAQIGQDGIAVITHPDNPVPALALDKLSRIFQGRITNWNQVGGPNLTIQVISRESGADTRQAFQALVMGDARTTLNARLALSSQSMVTLVAADPGAIGYVSMALADSRVRVIPIAAAGATPVLPTPDTVNSGLYPLRTPILVVGPQPPAESSPYRDWFAWMQSEAGQNIVRQKYGRRPD
jgi:phosphate transport system substrate-binding protein